MLDVIFKIAKSDPELAEFLAVLGYRIKYLWDMTKNYVSSAQRLFARLKSDITSASISSLTIVTSMGVGLFN